MAQLDHNDLEKVYLQSALEHSCLVWHKEFVSLFIHAKDRFGDVMLVSEQETQDDEEYSSDDEAPSGRVWAHQGELLLSDVTFTYIQAYARQP
ncbi:hypothetical protein GALMADRAFT_246802 [Galerina marginata CBS 339.88]|uniref:Uncharacterized protein n=1 Tax=Galerina marginata (strain CBS 339.88) TaxID=685588 RepID=A0A067T2D7_GALM3|nr:hypothetical protein GALMADRAFT_246802 [Galerina marginata CBS 339.88]